MENYKKKYNEALEAMSDIIPDENGLVHIRPSDIFSELAESEDEKIKQRFIKLVKMSSEVGGFALHKWEADEMLAWLEKQGNKPQGKTALEAICEEKVDNANKVEQKFHEDDYIVNNISGDVFKVTEIKDDEYCIWPLDAEIMGYVRIVDVDNDYHLWIIQDAKDGDVLVFKNNIGGIIICKSPTYYDTRSYCRLVSDNLINKEESGWDSTLLVPATKEQRDLLFQKMKEAGYEWDAEKKELKKIEKKSTWNEDDERIYQSIIDDTVQENQLNCEQTNWLRDIKYRYFQQPKQEWSEEDEEIMSGLLSFLLINTSDQWAKYGKWILSLKERMRK